MIDSAQIASPFKISSVVSRAGTPAVTAWTDNLTTTLQFGGGTANTTTSVHAAAAGTVNIGSNAVAQSTNLGSAAGASTTVVRAGSGSVHFAVNGANKWSVDASNGDLLPTITNTVNVGEDSAPKRIGNVYAHNSLKVNDGVTSVVVSATAVTASASLGLTAGGANPISFTVNAAQRGRFNGTGTFQLGDGTIGAAYDGSSLAASPVMLQSYSNSSTGRMQQHFMQFNAAAVGPSLNFFHARGTAASPTATQAGDEVGVIGFSGVTASPSTTGCATIIAYADEIQTTSAWGGHLRVYTTPTGTTTQTERLRITNQGTHYNGDVSAADNTMNPLAGHATVPISSIRNSDSYWRIQSFDAVSFDNTSVIQGCRSRGTAAVPTSPLSGDHLFRLSALGSITSGSYQTGAHIIFRATENWVSPNNHGGELSFWTQTNGVAGNPVERWDILNTGHLVAFADNTYDIGASGTTRPRTVYARTSFVAEGATNSLSFSDGGITQSAGGLGITSTGASLNLAATGAFAVQVATNGSTRWLVDSAGHFQAGSDNAYDIGATGAGTRPRSIYVRTSFIAQGAANALTAADGSITQSAGGLTVTSTAAGLILAATGANTVALHTNSTARLTLADTTATLADAVNLVVGTTTGTKIGTSTTQKLGFWNSAPVVQQASAALTNNVTSGGTSDQIDDFGDLAVYATDAATIRNDIYQLARKLKEVGDALRLYGILG